MCFCCELYRLIPFRIVWLRIFFHIRSTTLFYRDQIAVWQLLEVMKNAFFQMTRGKKLAAASMVAEKRISHDMCCLLNTFSRHLLIYKNFLSAEKFVQHSRILAGDRRGKKLHSWKKCSEYTQNLHFLPEILFESPFSLFPLIPMRTSLLQIYSLFSYFEQI